MQFARFMAWSVFSVATLHVGISYGQDYPTKPVRLVVPGTGGGSDFAARLIAPGISGPLGQPVIVDNRGGVLAQEIVSKALPDGYNILVVGTAQWIGPLVRPMPYDAIKDFAPVTLIATSPALLLITPSVPAKTVKELIAYAKAHPGEINYSSAGVGGAAHLAGQLFNTLAGVNTVHVPYKSGSSRLADLLSGQIQMTYDSGPVLMENVKAGKLRVLGVTSLKPSALYPDLPTVAETLPGFSSESVTAMFATAKTPAPIVNKIRRETVGFLNQPDTKQKFFSSGAEVVGSTPEQLAATVQSEVTKWSKVIKDNNIKAE